MTVSAGWESAGGSITLVTPFLLVSKHLFSPELRMDAEVNRPVA